MVFLQAVGILCLISGVLAFLLTVADRLLHDYGLCRIRINDGARELEIPGGSSLLSSLVAQRIFIPSACGGGGSCGLCKLRVLRGGGPVLATEEPHLSAEEIAAGMRLSCQVKVREDLDIEIPEALFRVREYQSRLVELEDLTHDIKRIRLELIDPETIEFTPGAYIQVQNQPYGKVDESVYRAYSLASDPADRHHVELLIRLVPGGICTTWIFEHLAVGDEVRFNGPHGEFCLQDTDAEKIFIAGGSGMAPFRSILLDMRRSGNPCRCRFFFGAVSGRDMFFEDEMKQFERDLPDFAFIPALSTPAPEDHWEGETGLITDVVARHYPDCTGREAYLCGSPGMINACVRVLTGLGMPEENIFYDKFA